MSENQEQKSQSEDTILDPVIEPMAQPHRIIVSVPYDEIREGFDKFWSEHEEDIIKKFKIKGRKLKGGKVKDAQKIAESNIGIRKLYTPVLIEKIHDKIKDVLFVEDVAGMVDEGNENIFKVYGRFYYTPKITLEKDPDFKVLKQFNEDIEAMYQRRLEDLQRKYRVVQEYQGEDIKEDHNVLIDIIASCEEKPYDRGTSRNTYIHMSYFPEEIKTAIMEHKKGDLFEASYVMDKRDPELEGKTVNVHIKIYDVQEIIYPEINDDLVKEENFESLEKFHEKFIEDYTNYLDNSKRGMVMEHVITDILTDLHHPEVPQCWLDANVASFERNILQKFQGDKDRMMMSLRANDKDELYNLLKGEVLRDLVRVMALRAYADYYELDPKDDDNILDHMLERVEWIEPETPQ